MKKILFVEDESALQKTMGDALSEEGYEVAKALNGEDGWKIAKKGGVDLILLDLILPKMDGFELLEQLKKNEDTKNIPIVILTNLEGSENIERALRLGATTYLVKANYDLEDIVEKVKESL